MACENLNGLLDDLVDVGTVVQAAIQKRMMAALTMGIKKLPEVTAHKEWQKIAEELKSLNEQDKAASLALLQNKLHDLQNPVVEQKALKCVDVALQAFKVIQQAVEVAKQAQELVKEI